MVVYHLKCKECQANYISQSKKICNIRKEDHKTDEKSHVYEHHNTTGHEILERADSTRKLEPKLIKK